MKHKTSDELTLVPSSGEEIARVRERCRRMVKKRAAFAAGVAAVPLPGVDVLSDLATFALVVEEVNKAFGLTPDQIKRLRTVAYTCPAKRALEAGFTFEQQFVVADRTPSPV